MRFHFATPLRLVMCLLLAGSLVTFSACDAVEDAVNDAIPDASVNLGQAGQNVPVVSGEPQTTSANVDGLDRDFPNAVEVQGIELEGLSYTPIAAKNASKAASGNVQFFLILDEVPVLGATINVVNDAVTGYSPNPIELGVNSGDFTSCLDQFDEAGQPDLRDNYSSVNVNNHLFSALESDSFSLQAMVCVSGDLAGTLQIERAVFDLGV